MKEEKKAKRAKKLNYSTEAIFGSYTGTYVIGEPGTGKTTMLERQIVHHASLGHSIIVIEGHGDFSRHLLRTLPETCAGHILSIDPERTEKAFGVNLFQLPDDPRLAGRMTTQAMELFRKVWGENWGPRIEMNLQLVALTAAQHPGLTLADVPLLFEDKAFRERIVAGIADPDLRREWERYGKKSTHQQDLETESTLNKVKPWSMSPVLKPMIGQERSSLNWREVMDTGRIVLVRLAREPVLGETYVSLLGTAIINQITMAAFSRADIPEEERKPVLLVCDEFHLFATPDFAELFTGGRKFGIMTTVAHQNLAQIDDPKVKAAILGAGQKVVFRVGGDDAVQLAKQFDHTPPEREITGYRLKPTLSVRPLEALRQRGHEDTVVMSIFNRHYAHLLEAQPGRDYNATSSGDGFYPYRGEEALKGVRLLDRLLVKAMQGQFNGPTAIVDDREFREALKTLDVVWAMTTFLALATRDHLREIAMPIGPGHPRFEAFITDPDSVSIPDGGGSTTTNAVTYRDRTKKISRYDRGAFKFYWLPSRICDEICAAHPTHDEDVIGWETVHAIEVIKDLINMAFRLEDQPIYDTGTEPEPIYGPVRSYADMENEITTKLVHLPNHTAMVRSGIEEDEVKMAPPVPTHEPIVVVNPWPRRDDVLRAVAERQAPQGNRPVPKDEPGSVLTAVSPLVPDVAEPPLTKPLEAPFIPPPVLKPPARR